MWTAQDVSPNLKSSDKCSFLNLQIVCIWHLTKQFILLPPKNWSGESPWSYGEYSTKVKRESAKFAVRQPLSETLLPDSFTSQFITITKAGFCTEFYLPHPLTYWFSTIHFSTCPTSIFFLPSLTTVNLVFTSLSARTICYSLQINKF